MSKNRVFDNLNHVVDAFTVTKKSKKSSPKSQLISPFNFMKINNLKHELNKLSVYVACTSYNVFNLFFNNEILQKIVEYINEYAKKHYSQNEKSYARKWFLITLKELRAYIAIFVYMKVYNESFVPEYWNKDSSMSSLHLMVYEKIFKTRWKQIDRFLRIS